MGRNLPARTARANFRCQSEGAVGTDRALVNSDRTSQELLFIGVP